jgi:hypothetical protein
MTIAPIFRRVAAFTMPVVVALAVAAGQAYAQSAPAADTRVTPGEFVVEHPTLINLGFEWHIAGDTNRNASVEVSYR